MSLGAQRSCRQAGRLAVPTVAVVSHVTLHIITTTHRGRQVLHSPKLSPLESSFTQTAPVTRPESSSTYSTNHTQHHTHTYGPSSWTRKSRNSRGLLLPTGARCACSAVHVGSGSAEDTASKSVATVLNIKA